MIPAPPNAQVRSLIHEAMDPDKSAGSSRMAARVVGKKSVNSEQGDVEPRNVASGPTRDENGLLRRPPMTLSIWAEAKRGSGHLASILRANGPIDDRLGNLEMEIGFR
jgi:hypothetical protein